jgi:hypothetical protein
MSFDPLPTPNPNEFAVRVWASPQKVLQKMGGLVAGTTTLKAADLCVVPSSEEDLGSYLYLKPLGKREDGALGFVFTKPKTAEELKRPFKTWREQGNHYWHGILHSVKFFLDRSFPLSTNGTDGGIVLAPRMYERIKYTPPVSEGSIFEHRLYFGPTKFHIGPSPVPVPTAVSWSYHGSNGSFPECLHPLLKFPAVQSAFAAYSTGGGAVAAEGVAGGQVFHETNFTEWAPYTVKDGQDEVETGWLRHEVIVQPPEQPEVDQR